MENIQEYLLAAARTTTVVQAISANDRSKLLKTLAGKLLGNIAEICRSNQTDLDQMDDSDPKKDRLALNEERVSELANSIEDISALPDPANRILSETTLANGLHISKIAVPLGVVGVIYESRPNVTIDVAALCIRSGNVCLLRGGSDALHTNQVLVSLIHESLKECGLPVAWVQLLPPDRKFVTELLSATRYVDMIIPRGSQQLINFVRQNAKVPVIETGAGVCHTYVHQEADLQMAVDIVANAKISRPSVCNALDTILVDRKIAAPFLRALSARLAEHSVMIFADEESYSILDSVSYPHLTPATDEHFGREFLSLQCSVKIVGAFEEAADHIARYSSKHSEAIVTENSVFQTRFLSEVDAAAVYVNASTRFTDGGEFGLGAEIGISTQKLHARGPFALEKLVTEKWLIRGQGQIR